MTCLRSSRLNNSISSATRKSRRIHLNKSLTKSASRLPKSFLLDNADTDVQTSKLANVIPVNFLPFNKTIDLWIPTFLWYLCATAKLHLLLRYKNSSIHISFSVNQSHSSSARTERHLKLIHPICRKAQKNFLASYTAQ